MQPRSSANSSEEAHIQIETGCFFNVYELVNPPAEHRVIVYLNAIYLAGEPAASSDLSEVRFFLPLELEQLSRQKQISPFVEQVLRDAKLLSTAST